MEAKEIPDIQLEELLETIRSEGVDKGRRESRALLDEARAQAEEIRNKAGAEAERILSEARRERDRLEQAGRESLRQAGRDLLLQVQRQLQALFSAILRREAAAALKGDELSAAILKMISAWKPDQQDITLLLPEDLHRSLGQSLQKALAEKLAAGIDIKVARDLTTGFRVSVKDGNSFFDFSAESVAEALAQYLNPMMAEIIKESLEQEA